MRPKKPLIKLLKQLSEESGVDNYLLMAGIGPATHYQTQKLLNEAKANGRPFTDRVDIILQSGGGQAADAYRLIRAFRSFYKEVNIIVPFWAKSAATLMTFGADLVVMGEYGELGPLDAQILKSREDAPSESRDSAVNIQASLMQIENRSRQGFLVFYQLLKNDETNNIKISPKALTESLLNYSQGFYAPLLAKIDTEEIGRMARALEIGKMYAKKMVLQYHTGIDKDELEKFLNYLIYDCPDHGYIIDYPLVSQYLPYVVEAIEAPYGEKYNSILNEMYTLLIEAEITELPPLIGFVDSLYDKVIGKDTTNEQIPPSKNATSKSGRPRGRPKKDGNQEQTSENAGKPDEPKSDNTIVNSSDNNEP